MIKETYWNIDMASHTGTVNHNYGPPLYVEVDEGTYAIHPDPHKRRIYNKCYIRSNDNNIGTSLDKLISDALLKKINETKYQHEKWKLDTIFGVGSAIHHDAIYGTVSSEEYDNLFGPNSKRAKAIGPGIVMAQDEPKKPHKPNWINKIWQLLTAPSIYHQNGKKSQLENMQSSQETKPK